MNKVWDFEIGRVAVALYIGQEPHYQYDGDDEDGETQAAIDSGDLVAFYSRVIVEVDGEEIASDSLGGSVYYFGQESEFWTGHRDKNPLNRNCTIMREARGSNAVVCHYFPSMVSGAIQEARAALAMAA